MVRSATIWIGTVLLAAVGLLVLQLTSLPLPDEVFSPQLGLKLARPPDAAARPSDGTGPSPPQAEPPPIIPLPMDISCASGEAAFVLDRGTRLLALGLSSTLLKFFCEHWSRLFGFEVQLAHARAAGASAVEVQEKVRLPREGYLLEVRREQEGGSTLVIGVSAESQRASLLHALQTLRQMMPAAAFRAAPAAFLPARVQACKVLDWPRYKWRGLMLDVARHFFDVEHVKRLLLLMSMHKLNVLHLHLSDDQGWRIEVKGKPELTNVGARRGGCLNNPSGDEEGGHIYNAMPYKAPRFFSQADIRDIVSFAANLEIDIVPEIDMPAHAAALIVAARSIGKDFGVVELHEGCAARQGSAPLMLPPNCMGGTHGIVIPTKQALDYVLSAIAELIPLFPSRFFHLGGDEADEFRDEVYSSEAVERLKEELGLATSASLQGYMVTQIYQLLRAHNKTALAWDETHIGLEDYTPPKDLLAVWWRDWSPEASWEAMLAYGRQFIIAPTSKLYFDIYQQEPHSASRYRVQEGTVALRDTYGAAQLESSKVLGVQGCLWSEHLESWEVLEYQLFPRGAALAEVGWTPKAKANDFDGFLLRWRAHLARLDALGVGYYNGSYVGEVRKEERGFDADGWPGPFEGMDFGMEEEGMDFGMEDDGGDDGAASAPARRGPLVELSS